VDVQPHRRQRAHNVTVPRRPRDHPDRSVVVGRRGLCAGQPALWRRVGRGYDRVGRLRLESLARPCACAGDDDTTGDAAQRSGTSSACLARSLRLQGARLWEEPSTSCLGSSLPLFTLLPGKKENSAKFECKILYSPYPSCWGSDSSRSNAF
jgi:hypothetical protein